jgi:hypothetical protein
MRQVELMILAQAKYALTCLVPPLRSYLELLIQLTAG